MVSPHVVEFRAGMLAFVPMLLDVVPFGLTYGMLATSAGMPVWLAVAVNAIVFGGASQMILVQLWADDMPASVTTATTSMVSLRYTLYSVSIAPALAHLLRRWKWPIAYLLTGEASTVTSRRVTIAQAGSTGAAYRYWYFLGAGVALWSGWWTSTIVDMVLGAQMSTSWPLDFFPPLTFIVTVMPVLRTHAQLAATLAGITLAMAWMGWPHKLGLINAACVGITVGALVERLFVRPSDKGATA